MTSYLNANNPATCYGCRACEQICPQQAIVIKGNAEGFLYPQLLEDRCVNCGLCSKVCPYDSPSLRNLPIKAVAAQHKESGVLTGSSSGGIFSAIAEYVLENNGYVAGCIFDDSFAAIHILTNREDLAAKMRGSKYVQSDVRDVYSQIQTLLKEGVLVLFTGTPCQVDGLRCFLRKDYDNLLTVDLICHGVPSPNLFKSFLQSECHKNRTIADIKFRDKKRNGWCSKGSITYSDTTKTISPYNCSYYQLYYFHNSVSRLCCYSCKYAAKMRVGDLTIGDYWNAPYEFPKLDTTPGVSAVLVNTTKGERLLAKIADRLNIHDTTVESVVRGNGNLSGSGPMPESRRNIYSRITREGYDAVAKEDCKFQYVRPFIRKLIPIGLKRLLKKILK